MEMKITGRLPIEPSPHPLPHSLPLPLYLIVRFRYIAWLIRYETQYFKIIYLSNIGTTDNAAMSYFTSLDKRLIIVCLWIPDSYDAKTAEIYNL